MSTAIAILAALTAMLSGLGSHTPVCETTRFEDNSKIEMCYTATAACSAWFDAEEQKLSGIDCKVN
jgi:hypothetical protein